MTASGCGDEGTTVAWGECVTHVRACCCGMHVACMVSPEQSERRKHEVLQSERSTPPRGRASASASGRHARRRLCRCTPDPRSKRATTCASSAVRMCVTRARTSSRSSRATTSTTCTSPSTVGSSSPASSWCVPCFGARPTVAMLPPATTPQGSAWTASQREVLRLVLEEHVNVQITGEPGAGKTEVASALMVTRLHQAGGTRAYLVLICAQVYVRTCGSAICHASRRRKGRFSTA